MTMSEQSIREELIKLDNNMGKKGVDRITGFSGVMVAYTVHMTGCNQVYLLPKVDKDGKKAEGGWFDEPRIDWEEASVKAELKPSDKPGASEASYSGRRV